MSYKHEFCKVSFHGEKDKMVLKTPYWLVDKMIL